MKPEIQRWGTGFLVVYSNRTPFWYWEVGPFFVIVDPGSVAFGRSEGYLHSRLHFLWFTVGLI